MQRIAISLMIFFVCFTEHNVVSKVYFLISLLTCRTMMLVSELVFHCPLRVLFFSLFAMAFHPLNLGFQQSFKVCQHMIRFASVCPETSSFLSLCTMCVFGACRSQKKALDSPRLEYKWLRATMLDLGLELGSSGRADNALTTELSL